MSLRITISAPAAKVYSPPLVQTHRARMGRGCMPTIIRLATPPGKLIMRRLKWGGTGCLQPVRLWTQPRLASKPCHPFLKEGLNGGHGSIDDRRLRHARHRRRNADAAGREPDGLRIRRLAQANPVPSVRHALPRRLR